ncbi:MAG: flagellar biosynthesis protein FlhB [Deltaproteobacteria bacterium HGW-Deltaproteobacteria-15]|jgi:flagellar biosynthetic protein FlhB|nr:MAG: flagellar biosynthesis protein FlhB [Deltaproteobacteria bacterium HGW-Deltaproteobacteria-15]
MAEDRFQDKTEPASPKRREEARKKGEVAKSKELGAVAVLCACTVYLFFAAKGMSSELGMLMERTFSRIPSISASDMNIVEFSMQTLREFLLLILPIMILAFVVALGVNYLQVGFLWSVEALAPKASKIDPVQGLQRMFSVRSLSELAKSLAKLTIVGWVAFSTLKEAFPNFVPLIYQDRWAILSWLGLTSWKLTIRCCMVIAVLAILDYFYQRWEFERKLRMSKQELKDEYKQTEGDPMVKSRIRSIQREMARRRMMEEVPKADVVITNPTHLAIALRYDSAKMKAPKIVAKGADHIALRIRGVAEQSRVPVVENRPLAQNLYKLELGEEIPSRLYQAVAEILAYVYRLKKKGSTRA